MGSRNITQPASWTPIMPSANTDSSRCAANARESLDMIANNLNDA
jgi:hypothetical protein